jgi:hypothetical protein
VADFLCLRQVAFEGIGSMPMAKITASRSEKQVELEEDFRRRDAKKNLRSAIQEGTSTSYLSPSTLAEHANRIKLTYGGGAEAVVEEAKQDEGLQEKLSRFKQSFSTLVTSVSQKAMARQQPAEQ